MSHPLLSTVPNTNRVGLHVRTPFQQAYTNDSLFYDGNLESYGNAVRAMFKLVNENARQNVYLHLNL